MSSLLLLEVDTVYKNMLWLSECAVTENESKQKSKITDQNYFCSNWNQDNIQAMYTNLFITDRNDCSGDDFPCPPNSFPGRRLTPIKLIKDLVKDTFFALWRQLIPIFWFFCLHVMKRIFILTWQAHVASWTGEPCERVFSWMWHMRWYFPVDILLSYVQEKCEHPLL